MAMGGLYPSREFVGLSGVLKSHHTNIQALFRRYRASPLTSRPAIVEEILYRLHSHLAMEGDVLLNVIRDSGPYGLDFIEDAILEHEDIQAMFHQLLQAEIDDGGEWDEMFEDMMQTARVHFLTEERDLLPLVDRSRDA
jgi:hypothetical protein